MVPFSGGSVTSSNKFMHISKAKMLSSKNISNLFSYVILRFLKRLQRNVANYLKFWVTLEFSRHHGNLKPKRFDFCIKFKPIDRTCPFHYQWLELHSFIMVAAILQSKWRQVIMFHPNFRFDRCCVFTTSSPKGNDRSPESNVPRSNLI